MQVDFGGYAMEELFIKRIEESNIFNKEEIELIKSSYILYERCYLLGLLDAK